MTWTPSNPNGEVTTAQGAAGSRLCGFYCHPHVSAARSTVLLP